MLNLKGVRNRHTGLCQTTTNIVISRIIYLNVERVHHIFPEILDEVRVPVPVLLFEPILSDIFHGEQIILIGYMDDDTSTVIHKTSKIVLEHSLNCERD